MKKLSRSQLFIVIYILSGFFIIHANNTSLETFELIRNQIRDSRNDSLEYAKKIARDFHDNALITNNSTLLSRSFFLLGYCEVESNYQNAINYFNRASKIAKNIKDSFLLAEIYFQRGLINYYLANYLEALKLFHKSLDYYIQNDLKQDIADVYQNLGMVYDELSDKSKALEYYLRSLEINKDLKNETAYASVSHNIGVIYADSNDLDKALKYYKQSLDHFKKINFKEGIAIVINNIGNIYEKKGSYHDALISYRKALELFEELNSKRLIVIANYNVGKAYKGLKNYNQAKKYFNESIALAKTMDIIDYIARSYFDLSEIYEIQGDYDIAISLYKKYNSLDDSIANMENQAKIIEIESRFSNELTQKELELKTKKLNKKTQILYVFIVSAFLFLVVILLLIIQSKQKLKAQKELMKHRDYLEKMIRKKTEALEIEISERKIAEESDKLKSAFLANMSHEIRTPMNSIIAFSNYLRDPELTQDKREEYIQYIISCGKNLLQIINDILDIAKLEAYQLKIKKEPFNISELLKETYQMFKEHKSHILKKVKFSLNKQFLNENININSDYQRLQQILTNLLENAFKYTSKGSIDFGIENIKNNLIFFYVKDTGIGIPIHKNKIIFERFQQVEIALEKKSGGTGLGLAICKNLAELLGGKIWVVSQQGQGSIFCFTLPINISGGHYSKNINKIQNQEINKQYNWSNKKILVAEDENLNFKVIEIALKKTNAEIVRVKNGLEAVEYCLHNTIDLVLMDIQMPILDGYKATKKIKQFNPSIPVIAQTSFAMNEDKQKCFDSGCDDFVTKPLNLPNLFYKINKCLKIKTN